MYDLSDEGSQFHRAGALLTDCYHRLDEAGMHLGRTAQGALALKVDQMRKEVEATRREVERRRQEWLENRRHYRAYHSATAEQRQAGTLEGSQADVSALGNP